MYSKMRWERFRQGISQSELEKSTGIQQGLLSLFERNLRCPGEKHRKQIAKALGCSPDDLFSESEKLLLATVKEENKCT